MFDQYFSEREVNLEFKKEYISLWPGWLGKENLHALDNVSDEAWSRFNSLILEISQHFSVGLADCALGIVSFPEEIEPFLSSREQAATKDSSSFLKIVVPSLDCIITEEWDYTYILWHRNGAAIVALKPYILNARLYHFAD